MEFQIRPGKKTILSFPKREQRNQNRANFEASIVKKINLSPVSYTVSGITGDVLIRSNPPKYIREYVESHASEIDGHYSVTNGIMNQELQELLDDTLSLRFGGIKIEDGMTLHEIINRGGDISSLL
jgi:hypothetical protein